MVSSAANTHAKCKGKHDKRGDDIFHSAIKDAEVSAYKLVHIRDGDELTLGLGVVNISETDSQV